MKTFKFIAISFIAIAFFYSCTINEHPSDVYEESWYVEEFTVKNWKLVGAPDAPGSYFEYVYANIPLDPAYFDGIITAYIYENYDTPAERQLPLPHTYYELDNNVPYSVQYTYELRPNNTIAFKVYVSDYYTAGFNPGIITFRLTIIW